MTSQKKFDNETFLKAKQALDKLNNLLTENSDVSLIDIGLDSVGGEQLVVLRIHVKKNWIMAKVENQTQFPNEVDGIPVKIITADYKLQRCK